MRKQVKKYDSQPFELVKSSEIAKGIFDFELKNPQLAKITKPGQFVHIAVPGKVLRRPISVCDVNGDTIRIVFRIKGEGTRILSETRVGDKLDLIAPLGNGFEISDDKKYAFIGGGIGTPPMLYLAKSCAKAKESYAILGFASKSAVILERDFNAVVKKTIVTTDDGSYGIHGFVTTALTEIIDEVDEVCACGPTPMLRAVSEICSKNQKPCQVSLEERMGCGIGACLVCACKVKHGGEEEYLHVCKNGPVFKAEEVVWDD